MSSKQVIRHCSVSMEIIPHCVPSPYRSSPIIFRKAQMGSLSCPAGPWHPPDSFPDLPSAQLALPNIHVHAGPMASGAEQPRLSLEIKEIL